MSDDAGEQWPISIEDAAKRFGCGPRRLKAIAKQHGIGKKAGRRILLDKSAVDELYQALPSYGARSSEGARLSAGPSPAEIARMLKKHKDERAQRGASRRAKRDYLKNAPSPVVPFAPPKSR